MTLNNKEGLFQRIPKVDRLLEESRIAGLADRYPRPLVVDEVRAHLEGLRQALERETLADVPDHERIVEAIVRRVRENLRPGVERCVNGAGIVLHTALGRAPLSAAARTALLEAAEHYCTLQINRETGKRGDRYASVERLLKKLTGAEAAIVVNNNAAATLLILNTLAEGKEVVISRGELIEIGGSFRIPDVLRRSGARLVEVGTTNRTHLKDYKGAVTPDTGALMKVHQSNYRIIGFTKEVTIAELAALGRELRVPVVDDIGSGALVDLSRWGLPKEPMPQESVAAGADLVCFSGDKLLGGPQCGIIIGRKSWIEKIKANQLTRALRCDKLTFAVLEATLQLFLDPEKLQREHAVLRHLTATPEEIRRRAERLREALLPVVGKRGRVQIARDTSEVGSGSMAETPLPTWVVTITIAGLSAEELARALRHTPVTVVGRIKEEAVLLDCRTINDDELPLVADAFKTIVAE